MSKFNELTLNLKTPPGTLIRRINSSYSDCRKNQIYTLASIRDTGLYALTVQIMGSNENYDDYNFEIVIDE